MFIHLVLAFKECCTSHSMQMTGASDRGGVDPLLSELSKSLSHGTDFTSCNQADSNGHVFLGLQLYFNFFFFSPAKLSQRTKLLHCRNPVCGALDQQK